MLWYQTLPFTILDRIHLGLLMPKTSKLLQDLTESLNSSISYMNITGYSELKNNGAVFSLSKSITLVPVWHILFKVVALKSL